MATESSEPRTGLILRLGALCLVTLFVVHFGLSAYFDRMAKAEELRKRGNAVPEALINLRADEKARLGEGAVPIDKAMAMLVEKGRMGAGPAITPTPSKDLGPLQGWSKMPGEVPAAMMAPPPPPAPVEPIADAGAAPSSGKPDAGPHKAGPAHPTHDK
jgi:hypothetical protein